MKATNKVCQKEGGRRCILAVYVDNIIHTGDHIDEITRIKVVLTMNFEVKDQGDLTIFFWNGSYKVKDRDLCVLKEVYSGSL